MGWVLRTRFSNHLIIWGVVMGGALLVWVGAMLVWGLYSLWGLVF